MRSFVVFLIIMGVVAFLTCLTFSEMRKYERTNQYGTKEFIEYDDYGTQWRVMTIDGCEYIQGNKVFVHKEDCKNPTHR